MTYSREQLVDALSQEYERLCHDVPEDSDMTYDEHLQYLSTLSYDELVAETCTDDCFTLDEYMEVFS